MGWSRWASGVHPRQELVRPVNKRRRRRLVFSRLELREVHFAAREMINLPAVKLAASW